MNSMAKVLLAQQDTVQVLKFVGDVRVCLGSSVTEFLDQLEASDTLKSIVIDLTETESIDSTSLGLLAKIAFILPICFNTTSNTHSNNADHITRCIKISVGGTSVICLKYSGAIPHMV